MDIYPAEEHLTPNIVYTTVTVYVPVSMVCTHLKGSCGFFPYFFCQKKNGWERFEESVELS